MRVLPIGMDERYEAAFRVIFSKPETRFDFDAAAPQLLVVDLSLPQGYVAWEIARKEYPNAHVVILAHSQLDLGHLCFSKPFDPLKLYEAARDLCMKGQGPQSEEIAQGKIIVEENPESFENASNEQPERRRKVRKWGEETHYNPRAHLQYYWEQAAVRAIKSNEYVAVLGLPFDVLFDGAKKVVYIDKTDQALKLFCMALVRKERLSLYSTTNIEKYMKMPTQPMESFLWKTAIWTARGRLPAGCDPEEAVRLKRWPNLTRLFKIPHAPRLAALWSSRPASPLQMIKSAEAAPQEVFDFYSGCKTLGLIQKLNLATPTPMPPMVEQKKTNTQRPILSWIIDKIRQTF